MKIRKKSKLEESIMRISLSLLLSVLILASITLGGGQSKEPEADAVRDLLDAYADACQKEDLDALSHIFANRPDTIKITAVSSRVHTGWKTIKEAYRNFFLNVDDCKMQFAVHAIQVLAEGKVVCVTGHQEATMWTNGRVVTFKDARVTLLLEKINGELRIVNAHWSLVQRP